MIFIFNFVFTIVFYTTTRIKMDLTHIYSEEFFTNINYTYILTKFTIICTNITTTTHDLIHNIQGVFLVENYVI
jgi:hypothetical protein